MKLNHLNLTVTDVPGTRAFLAKHFGLKDMSGNHNMAFLSDDNGMVLTLTSLKVGGETEVRYPALFMSASFSRARRASTKSISG